MAYFAVNLRHGFSGFQLKKMIDRIFPEEVKGGIKSIIEPLAFVQKKTGKKVRRMAKNMSYGYVYLNIETNAKTIPSKVYQHLNELPWITQIFSDDVPEDEVEAFCHNVGLKLEESEIVFEIESNHEEKIEELVDVINDANTTIEQRKEAEKQLEEELANPTCLVEKMKRLVQEGNDDVNKAVKVTVKKKRGRSVGQIRLSLGLVLKAAKEMEKKTGERVSSDELQSETFLLNIVHEYLCGSK